MEMFREPRQQITTLLMSPAWGSRKFVFLSWSSEKPRQDSTGSLVAEGMLGAEPGYWNQQGTGTSEAKKKPFFEGIS